jgi:hypothetical protein
MVKYLEIYYLGNVPKFIWFLMLFSRSYCRDLLILLELQTNTHCRRTNSRETHSWWGKQVSMKIGFSEEKRQAGQGKRSRTTASSQTGNTRQSHRQGVQGESGGGCQNSQNHLSVVYHQHGIATKPVPPPREAPFLHNHISKEMRLKQSPVGSLYHGH